MAGLFILFIVAALAAFAAIALRYGVDSRTESRDPRRAEYPVGIS
jgi:hypothetical protein